MADTTERLGNGGYTTADRGTIEWFEPGKPEEFAPAHAGAGWGTTSTGCAFVPLAAGDR